MLSHSLPHCAFVSNRRGVAVQLRRRSLAVWHLTLRRIRVLSLVRVQGVLQPFPFHHLLLTLKCESCPLWNEPCFAHDEQVALILSVHPWHGVQLLNVEARVPFVVDNFHDPFEALLQGFWIFVI